MSAPNKGGEPTYDRALLLHGSKRNKILTLREVQQTAALPAKAPGSRSGPTADVFGGKCIFLLTRASDESEKLATDNSLHSELPACCAQTA
jgi:hypothetical protein